MKVIEKVELVVCALIFNRFIDPIIESIEKDDHVGLLLIGCILFINMFIWFKILKAKWH